MYNEKQRLNNEGRTRMNISFLNNCVETMYIIVEDREYKLQPNQCCPIEITPSHTHKITIRSDHESYCHNGFYYLYVAAEYDFSNLDENCIFTITRKKVESEINIYLMKPELSVNQWKCFVSKYSVPDKKAVNKLFSKSRLADIFFWNVFADNFGELIIAVLIGIAIFCFSGWKAGIIYSVVAYGVLVLIDYLVDKFASALFKKIFKTKDDKEELQKFLNEDFLLDYLADK